MKIPDLLTVYWVFACNQSNEHVFIIALVRILMRLYNAKTKLVRGGRLIKWKGRVASCSPYLLGGALVCAITTTAAQAACTYTPNGYRANGSDTCTFRAPDDSSGPGGAYWTKDVSSNGVLYDRYYVHPVHTATVLVSDNATVISPNNTLISVPSGATRNGLNIGGNASFIAQKDLYVYEPPNTWGRAIYLSGNAKLEVHGNLTAWRDGHGGARAVQGDGTNTKIIVHGDTYLRSTWNPLNYSAPDLEGLRQTGTSTFHKNLVVSVLSENYASSTFNGHGIILSGSSSVGGDTTIEVNKGTGVVQEGASSTFTGGALTIEAKGNDATKQSGSAYVIQNSAKGSNVHFSGPTRLISHYADALSIRSPSTVVLGTSTRGRSAGNGDVDVLIGSQAQLRGLRGLVVQAGEVDVNIHLAAGSKVFSGGQGGTRGQNAHQPAILEGDGQTSLIVQSGAHVDGSIQLNAGEDTLSAIGEAIINGAIEMGAGDDSVFLTNNFRVKDQIYQSKYVVDGGDGLDEISFINTVSDYKGSNFTNFETIWVDASMLSLEDVNDGMVAGKDEGQGVFLRNGASLIAKGAQIIDANLDIGQGTLFKTDVSKGPISTKITGSLTNSGTIDMADGTSNDRLKVAGDFIANGGLIKIDSELTSDDVSTTSDRVLIAGNSLGGVNYVHVTNRHGATADGAESILVVGVEGKSDAVFRLQNRVVSGVYEYFLNKHVEDGSWYLESTYVAPPEPPVTPPKPPVTPPKPPVVPTEPPVTPPVSPVVPPVPPIEPPAPPLKPLVPPVKPLPIIRPEVGAIGVNARQASMMFNMTWRDRVGASQLAGTRYQKIWGRLKNYNGSDVSSLGQLENDYNRSVLQFGADLGRLTPTNHGAFTYGVMAGYGTGSGNSLSMVTGYNANSDISGRSFGAYASWIENENTNLGWYSDVWLIYADFKNTVQGYGMSAVNYDQHSLQASIEAGYNFDLGTWLNHAFWLQPQGELIWTDLDGQDFVDEMNTRIVSKTESLATRLGLRASLTKAKSDDGHVSSGYSEINWYHGVNAPEIYFGSYKSEVPSDAYKISLGYQYEDQESFRFTGEVAYHAGGNQMQSLEASLGLNYRF